MDIWMVAVLLVLGLGCGFVAGLLGIGGGMVLAPLLTLVFTWQGMPLEILVHAAIATSMGTILFTSISSMRAHHRRRAVRWRVVAAMTPGLVLGGVLAGGAAFALISAAWLALFFGLFVGYSALRMFVAKSARKQRELPGPAGLSVAGGGIGFLSGLVGAGGGFLSVPFMANRNVPLPSAVGTSAALGFPIALSNTIGYIWSGWPDTASDPTMLGYVAWPALIVVSVASMVAAPRGAALAHALPIAMLKRIFAWLLLVLACYMLWKSYTAFVA